MLKLKSGGVFILEISFRKTGDSEAILGDGWARAEPYGTWCVGESSVLRLPSSVMHGQTTLRLDVEPYLAAGRLPGQMLSLRVGGKELFNELIAQRTVVQVECNSEPVAEDASVSLMLVHPGGCSPRSFGLSADQRDISFLVRSLEILPEGKEQSSAALSNGEHTALVGNDASAVESTGGSPSLGTASLAKPGPGSRSDHIMYQTHEGQKKGMSDSARKLLRLKLPARMDGMSLLDIGCNEGYFCNEAVKRGARRVVGIDFYKPAIEFARSYYPDPKIEFRYQRWDVLPEGPFDVVLWTSSMHYERDPGRMFAKIADVLAPGGVFILECGVLGDPEKEMVFVQRQDDSLWYPTSAFLAALLDVHFASRRVSLPEVTRGDSVPRTVYHCHRRVPTVLLFRGETHQGKSSTARLITSSATKVVGLDLFVYRLAKSQYHHSKISEYVRDNFNANDLTSLYKGIDGAGLTREYIDLLSYEIASSDALVVIEGLLTDIQVSTLADVLGTRAIVWDSQRITPTHG